MKKLQKTAKQEEKTQKRLFIQKNPFSPLICKDRIATLYAQCPRTVGDITSQIHIDTIV